MFRAHHGEIAISTTFRRYSHIIKNGKRIRSTAQKALKALVIAEPLFDFTTSHPGEFEGSLTPALLHFFLEHSVCLPNCEKPKMHTFAIVSWPMVHQQHFYVLRKLTVEVWCSSVNEPTDVNCFIPVSAISSRVIFSIDKIADENVLIVVPLIE